MEAAQFKDKRVVADTTHTQSAAPVVGGEHVHHVSNKAPCRSQTISLTTFSTSMRLFNL
jgi:hypothetical protein